jgi:hypothetical protein
VVVAVAFLVVIPVEVVEIRVEVPLVEVPRVEAFAAVVIAVASPARVAERRCFLLLRSRSTEAQPTRHSQLAGWFRNACCADSK